MSEYEKVKILQLNLKREYWDMIKDGSKLVEYRLATEYWRKRLDGREYDEVHLLLGYPAREDKSRRIERKWAGCRKESIQHKEFGPDYVDVYAIDVSRELA
jgi:hypothetical protein